MSTVVVPVFHVSARTVATHAGVRLLKAPERRGDEVDVWRGYVTVIAQPRFQTARDRTPVRGAWAGAVV